MTLLVLPQMSNAKLTRDPSSNMASPAMHKLLLRNPRALSLGHEEKQGGNRETSLPTGYISIGFQRMERDSSLSLELDRRAR